MKKRKLAVVLCLLLLGGMLPAAAAADPYRDEIQALLDEACRKSGVPGMSVAVVRGSELFYYSSGFADREAQQPADENTLYELASVSKAFTGFGVLLLEEQGKLRMTDPVQDYLPWFVLRYRGKPVDMAGVTLNHFLHHTSGLTNGRHFTIPEGNTPDMLLKTVEGLNGAELAFVPGAQYSYGTVNYDVLGLVIETVSGQSYEDFMKTQVFAPLGLHHTYVYEEEARATGNLARGYRTSFLRTTPYDAPVYRGNKPAGYLISSGKDMARWMEIQLGLAEDIPVACKAVIEKSHRGNLSVAAEGSMYYAAGWMVNSDLSLIEHGGNNPNFTTQVMIFTKEETAVCLLSNGANTNQALALGIKNVLNGEPAQAYEQSPVQQLDSILSVCTVLLFLLAALLFVLSLRRRKAGQPLRKNGKGLVALLLLAAAACVLPPILVRRFWPTVFVWQPYSLLTAWLAFILCAAAAACFLAARGGEKASAGK